MLFPIIPLLPTENHWTVTRQTINGNSSISPDRKDKVRPPDEDSISASNRSMFNSVACPWPWAAILGMEEWIAGPPPGAAVAAAADESLLSADSRAAADCDRGWLC